MGYARLFKELAGDENPFYEYQIMEHCPCKRTFILINSLWSFYIF
jgi:hypothetical protein